MSFFDRFKLPFWNNAQQNLIRQSSNQPGNQNNDLLNQNLYYQQQLYSSPLGSSTYLRNVINQSSESNNFIYQDQKKEYQQQKKQIQQQIKRQTKQQFKRDNCIDLRIKETLEFYDQIKKYKQRNLSKLQAIKNNIKNLIDKIKSRQRIGNIKKVQCLLRFSNYSIDELKYSYNNSVFLPFRIYSLKDQQIKNKLHQLSKLQLLYPEYRKAELANMLNSLSINLPKKPNIQIKDLILNQYKILKTVNQQKYYNQNSSQIVKDVLNYKYFDIKEYLQSSQNSFINQVRFILIAGWVLNFYLAIKYDDSKCTNSKIHDPSSFTFLCWLWINGGLSMLVSFFSFLQPLFVEYAISKQKDQQYLQQSSSFVKTICNCCSCFRLCLSRIAKSLIIIKGFWITYGIVLYTFFLNSSDCQQDLLNYCGLQFLVFSIIIIYYVIKKCISTMKQCYKKNVCCCYKKQQLEERQNYYDRQDSEQKQGLNGKSKGQNQQVLESWSNCINKIAKFISCEQCQCPILATRIMIVSNREQLEKLIEKFVAWILVGYIFDIILAIQDNESLCLQYKIDGNQLTFRLWLYLDAIFGFILTAVIFITILRIIFARDQIQIFSNVMLGVEQIQLRWFISNWLHTIVLLITFCLRIAWILFGLVQFFIFFSEFKCQIVQPQNSNGLTPQQQQQQCSKNLCKDNVTNYFLFYFTQSLYFLYSLLMMICQGCRKNYAFYKFIQTQFKKQEQKNMNNRNTQTSEQQQLDLRRRI